MKHTLQCPKCDGRKLWRIEGLRADDDYSNTTGKLLPLVKNRGGAIGSEGTGRIDSYVCAGCGYTELWAEGFDELMADPFEGVTLLEGNKPQGTYR